MVAPLEHTKYQRHASVHNWSTIWSTTFDKIPFTTCKRNFSSDARHKVILRLQYIAPANMIKWGSCINLGERCRGSTNRTKQELYVTSMYIVWRSISGNKYEKFLLQLVKGIFPTDACWNIQICNSNVMGYLWGFNT